ncbi:MAG: GNAT family N-acetyltransferase [Sediminispirochaetaceae bacterium]
MNVFECIQVSAKDEDFSHVRRIRIAVFVEEQHIPAEMEFDAEDPVCFHVLGREDGTPVAAGRLVPMGPLSGSNRGDAQERAGNLSRIAVLPEYRGRGYGKEVVRTLEHIAREQGLTYLYLHPHYYLEKFYSSLGYTTVPGEESSVAGHPLILMDKHL